MSAEGLTLLARARAHGDRLAIEASEGRFTYADLLDASARIAARLLEAAQREDLEEARVAFLVPPGFAWVAVQWGVWRAGGIAVPLAVSHPPPELAYTVGDAGASVLIADPAFAGRLASIDEPAGATLTTDALLAAAAHATVALPAVADARRAMILYTSGTTSRPKGVVTTHANLRAQMMTLVEAWGWRADDHILGTLPLHHVHGIVNVVACALWSGARCTILPRFDAEEVWNRIARGDLTLFMAVPTIYARLIAAWEASPPARQRLLSEASARMRLMVSGSAALPVSVLETWRRITGHTLLERYGMTEIGMALSNPLQGERRAGSVGTPLPGVEIRLVDERGDVVEEGTQGEIEVRGESVFREYWNRPNATRAAFRDGWFRTGDIAVLEHGRYRILGRSSVDIIKTGGYKVSALEIEEALREHGDVRECAVVGMPDEEWGERVCAAVVARDGAVLDVDALRGWAHERLAPYKVPARMLVVAELPRNAMGKVTKPDVTRLFAPAPAS